MATTLVALLVTIVAIVQQASCDLPSGCDDECSEVQRAARNCSLSCSFDLKDLTFLTTLPSDNTTPYFFLSFVLNIALTEIKKNAFSNPIFSNVLTLDLSSNEINKIEKGAFAGLVNVTSLILKSNKLTNLQGGFLEELSSLEYLYLDRNQISSIESTAFKNLTKLKHLDLSRNLLTTINKEIFQYVPNLFVLYLPENQITTLSKDNFYGMTNLLQLDLHKNKITELHPKAFNGLESSLYTLDISENLITQYDPQFLESVPALDYLDLSNSRFTTIPHFNSSFLSTIILSSCNLEALPSNFFSDLPDLETIDLSNNALTTFPPGLFSGFNELTILKLENNSLTTMSTKTLEELYPPLPEGKVPRKIALFLSDNPWNCEDESLKETIAWCQQRNIPARFVTKSGQHCR